MKILVISDFDNLPLQISHSLKDLGEVQFLTTRNLEDSLSTNISGFNDKLTWYKNAIRSFIFRNIILKVNNRYSYYQDINENSNYYSAKKIIQKLKFVPDIIIILFDYRLLTTKTIKDLYEWSNAKIYWMIPDMKPMTGGCSYAAKCSEYERSCSSCPAISNYFMKNFAHKTLRKKINNLQKVSIDIITGSTMQYQQAKNSSLFRSKNIHKIYFPSSEKFFKFKNKDEARQQLNLITNKKVILLGATSLTEERKGVKFALSALENLSTKDKENTLLLLIGNGDMEKLNKLEIEYKNLGFVDYEKLALSYQSADLFICPTIDDSGPVMVSQSILCGTPVVAFKMGISIDFIENNKTGYICDLENFQQLSFGISQIVNASNEQYESMQKNCLERSHQLNFINFKEKLTKLLNDAG